MKRFLYSTSLFVILTLLLSGCASPLKSIPRKIVNIKAPDLKGGSEIKKRTGKHAYMIPNIVFSKGPRTHKLVALTFDDGPDVYYTSKILDILDRNKVKATFFIVGTRAQKHPEMVMQIVKAGHSIGNHTWDHADLDKISPEQIKAEVVKADIILTKITGYHTNLFRPPYGVADKDVVTELASMGYKVIDWSVDTRDWAKTPPRKILKYVKKELHPGGIILEHCAGGKGENLDNTVRALPEIISYLKEQGYTLVTIPELFGFKK